MEAAHNIPKRLFIVEGKKIEVILRRAVRHALLEHKRAGNSVAISTSGQVVLIPAEEIHINTDVEESDEVE